MTAHLVPSNVPPEQRREADATLQIPSTYVDRCSIHLGPLVTRLTFAEAGPLDNAAHIRVAVTMSTTEAIEMARMILGLVEKYAKLKVTASAGTHEEMAN